MLNKEQQDFRKTSAFTKCGHSENGMICREDNNACIDIVHSKIYENICHIFISFEHELSK